MTSGVYAVLESAQQKTQSDQGPLANQASVRSCKTTYTCYWHSLLKVTELRLTADGGQLVRLCSGCAQVTSNQTNVYTERTRVIGSLRRTVNEGVSNCYKLPLTNKRVQCALAFCAALTVALPQAAAKSIK